MTERNVNKTLDELTLEQWLQIRKEEGRKIDPDIAEVSRRSVYVVDPYEVYPNLSEECQCIGRLNFARSSGSDIWVWFGDLPDETVRRLRERGESGEFDDDSLPWLDE